MEVWTSDARESRYRGEVNLDRREQIISTEKLVRDVMHRGVITVDVETSAREAARMLVRHQVHALIVLDETSEACGVVTNTDILRAFGKNLEQTTVEQIMSSGLHAIAPTALLQEAVEMMLEHRVHQLVVLKGEPAQRRPVGIISRSDVVKELVADEPN